MWWNSYMCVLCLTNPCMFEIDNVCTIYICRQCLIHKLCWNIPERDGITTGLLKYICWLTFSPITGQTALDRGSECINIRWITPSGVQEIRSHNQCSNFSCKKWSFLQLPNKRKDKRWDKIQLHWEVHAAWMFMITVLFSLTSHNTLIWCHLNCSEKKDQKPQQVNTE